MKRREALSAVAAVGVAATTKAAASRTATTVPSEVPIEKRAANAMQMAKDIGKFCHNVPIGVVQGLLRHVANGTDFWVFDGGGGAHYVEADGTRIYWITNMPNIEQWSGK